uniref:YagK/YfjJ domain-containing protein n=1 Tax=Chitinimonas arctica TaxID=2594795 RepID=UPI001CC50626
MGRCSQPGPDHTLFLFFDQPCVLHPGRYVRENTWRHQYKTKWAESCAVQNSALCGLIRFPNRPTSLDSSRVAGFLPHVNI